MSHFIERVRDGHEQAVEEIRSGLREWNGRHSGIASSEDIVLTIRDAHGGLRAGLAAWRWGGAMELEFLWVHEEQQRGGIGSELLQELERIAVAAGCGTLYTNTYSFQAPAFYEKHGFRIAASIPGFPDGVERHFLVKDL